MNSVVVLSVLLGMFLGLIPPVCFAAGDMTGKRRRKKRRVVSANEPTREQMEERKRLIADQEAFLTQMSYGAEAAYQMGSGNPLDSNII